MPLSAGTAAVQVPGGAASCLPADQSCLTVSVSVGAPYSSRRRHDTATDAAVGTTHACCTAASYITVLGISFGSLLAILLVMCAIRWYLVRRSASRDATAAAELEKKRSKGLGADAIAALPEFVYQKEKDANDGEEEEERELECAVCLGAMVHGDAALRLPPCMHVFHRGCVDVWLREHSTCPVCRAEVVVRPAASEGCGQKGQEGGPSRASMSMAWTSQGRLVDDAERDLEAQL